jgi:hypothetical protein
VGFSPLISSVKSPVRSRHTLTTEQNRLQLPSYIQFFGISMGGKSSGWWKWLFAGVLAIRVVLTTVKRGEVVVDCVVNVVGGTSLLWNLKMGQGFEVYFF